MVKLPKLEIRLGFYGPASYCIDFFLIDMFEYNLGSMHLADQQVVVEDLIKNGSSDKYSWSILEPFPVPLDNFSRTSIEAVIGVFWELIRYYSLQFGF